MKIRIINGPNLNLLGMREVDVYGTKNYDQLLNLVDEYAKNKEVHVEVLQTNHEGEMIDRIQEYDKYDALIINPAAYSHTSVAILDAILAVKSIERLIIEVHLTNIYAREDFRKTSITASACHAVISGCGFQSYVLALEYIVNFMAR